MRSLPTPARRRFPRVLAAAALAATLVAARSAGAQTTSGCRPSDDDALVLRSYLRELVTATAPDRVALRTDIGLTAMDSTRVTLVTNDRVCAKVADAINAGLQTPNVARQLYVFDVGKSFAAQDPDHPSGGYWPTMIVSARHKLIGSVLAP